MTAADVLANASRWSVETSDALVWLSGLPDDCVDLAVTSPPYSQARQYGSLNFNLTGEDWVRWMFSIVRELSRVCRGLIAIVCDDQTRDYRWGATPFLLAADLHRAGYCLRHPACYFRFGVPGSGGSDWLRNDHEVILTITRGGKLPWAENTACGHIPRYAPGGEMSNRLKSGQRVGQFGTGGHAGGFGRKRNGEKEPIRNSSLKQTVTNGATEPGLFGEVEVPVVNPLLPHGDCTSRRASGTRRKNPVRSAKAVLANPGNVVRAQYDAEAVRQALDAYVSREIDQGDVIRCIVGGQNLGHPLAHENEAPFGVDLAGFFIKSFCPPDGITLDCFAGSGSTIHAALEAGRRGIGCDIRPDQADLSRRRLASVTPAIPGV